MMPIDDLPWWVAVPLFLLGTAAVLYQRRHRFMPWRDYLGFKEK